MKKLYVWVMIVAMVILTACSDAYQDAMDKGIESLGAKDYHQSALYFELALKEKADDQEAQVYFDLAKQMQEAMDAVEQYDYEVALPILQEVIENEAALQTVKDEAQKILKQIQEESELVADVERKLAVINDLISQEDYQAAQEELQLLQEQIGTQELLVTYQSEVVALMDDVNSALNKKVEADEPQQSQVQYATYSNERYGFQLQYPSDLTMDPPPTNGDGATFRNEDFTLLAYGSLTNVLEPGETIHTYYDRDLEDIPVEVSYQKLTNDWYVLSYNDNGIITYKKFFFGDSFANTLIITYPESKKDIYNPITAHIAETFVSTAE
ncbi:hypothetical protein MKZ01_06905 [Lysinibacillus endophyticus]|uniref:hypothetical protein n=1 Tax=Ureibacillus endophyticus TaxID=1978490 RepID=UPI00209E73DF|nr:hypothetical protein [Lysinibacillus endophyticus]MCP1144550.1 hypothetical protein [Lysinibacillus endophyticus]